MFDEHGIVHYVVYDDEVGTHEGHMHLTPNEDLHGHSFARYLSYLSDGQTPGILACEQKYEEL